jgi:transcriptional regulator with GAF, ATPase, and Fis domain
VVIEEPLKRNEWNQTRAAEELGLQRTYFTKLIRQKQICGRPPMSSSASAPDNNPDHT